MPPIAFERFILSLGRFRAVAKDNGLTKDQALTLMVINSRERQVVGRVLNYVGGSPQNMSRMINKLKDRELILIEKSFQDRRNVYLSIADGGKAICDKLARAL